MSASHACMTLTLRALVLVAVSASVVAAQPATVTCTIPALTAWQTAYKRGWTSNCLYTPGNTGPSKSLVDTYPPTKIGCFFTMPIVGVFPKAARATFFMNPIWVPNGLRNGWTLAGHTASGDVNSSSLNSPPSALVVRMAMLPTAGELYHIYFDSIRLRKVGGNCANAVNEAF